MKQIEYTKDQELVIKLLDPFRNLALSNYYNVNVKELVEIINKVQDDFGIKPKYLTLGEYIDRYGCGAYHDFIFEIKNIEINVSSTSEFASLYNSKLLDEYFVINDNKTDNGGDCCSYKAQHKLTLSKVEI